MNKLIFRLYCQNDCIVGLLFHMGRIQMLYVLDYQKAYILSCIRD
jgi:hypothetical protein